MNIQPNDWIAAGYFFSVANWGALNPKPGAIRVNMNNPHVNLPVSCSSNGNKVGNITVLLFDPNQLIPANDNNVYLTNNQAAHQSFQGAV